MKRKLISSGSPYERPVGCSRAVRVGDQIAVAGTAPIASDGSTACVGDAYGQAKRCLEIIREAVEKAGGRLEHVTKTRMMLSDIRVWEEVARAHGEYFGDIRPASTIVEVKGFVRPEWLVEIEADAVIEAEE
jgi:enamine deaminase RidA (YjgF/YER057c/UK114 family)